MTPVRYIGLEAEPTEDSRVCLFITTHAGLRLEDRFPGVKLRRTPFVMFTHFCDSPDERKPWCLPIQNGYLLGRWELAIPEKACGQYEFIFKATTAINEAQFRSSHFKKTKTVKVNVIRIMDELAFRRIKDFEKTA